VQVADLTREVFGPVLHVVRYRAVDSSSLVAAIEASGYGLTMGVHTRLSERAEEIFAASRVGNTYVNRNMVGAVVGVQPFGGEGLSGAQGPRPVARITSCASRLSARSPSMRPRGVAMSRCCVALPRRYEGLNATTPASGRPQPPHDNPLI
jgi:delta 1-pyrroline-5-carboxylate dehydrogenase